MNLELKATKEDIIFYKLGFFAGVVVLIGLVIDMVFGTMYSELITENHTSAEAVMALFVENPILGMYSLDLLNVIINSFMLVFLYALSLLHKKSWPQLAMFAFYINLLGLAFFMGNNAALPAFGLSRDFVLADTEGQARLLAALDTLLAKGAHGSPGILLGFLIPSISMIFYSILLIRVGIVPKVLAWVGLIGFIPLLLYAPLLAFFPSLKDAALIISMPGGLVMLVWIGYISVLLFKIQLVRNQD
jgi:hypothetical protein